MTDMEAEAVCVDLPDNISAFTSDGNGRRSIDRRQPLPVRQGRFVFDDDRLARLKRGDVAGRVAGFELQIRAPWHVSLERPIELTDIFQVRGDRRPRPSRATAVEQGDRPRLEIVVVGFPTHGELAAGVAPRGGDGPKPR